VTLDFNGKYELGTFEVMTTGSAAYRYVEPAGDADVGTVPRLDLQVVADEP